MGSSGALVNDFLEEDLGCSIFRMIAIRSSLLYRTVPTFVLAANASTDPNDFVEVLLV